MEIYLLDMGETMYGDSILITNEDKTILIDAGHPKDTESIASQIGTILNTEPPYKIDLLIITHCHSDHIGCAPELVRQGLLDIDTALLAHEKMGFGRQNSGDGAGDRLFSDSQKALLIALTEEDRTRMSTDALEEFLSDAVKLEDNYKYLISKLKRNGSKVIKYQGLETNGLSEIEDQFKDFGLKIIGPTSAHLVICADKLAAAADNYADSITSSLSDSIQIRDLVTPYKQILAKETDDEFGQDRPGPGAAKNNQSIVLKVEANGWKALLAGDMQLAKSEVGGLGDSMDLLIEEIEKEGPYDFIKLTHHSSYNGTKNPFFSQWLQKTKRFAHTGGVNDPTHPDPTVLKLLKDNSRKLKFARTDRNGLIKVYSKDGNIEMEVEKGRLNDFSTNEDSGENITVKKPEFVLTKTNAGIPISTPVLNSPFNKVEEKELNVEITAKVPHVKTKVTLTIEIEPEKKTQLTSDPLPNSIIVQGNEGRLQGLTFLTCSEKLKSNIGANHTSEVLSFLNSIPKSNLVDIPGDIKDVQIVWNKLSQSSVGKSKGILIIGGYDVIPSLKLNVIQDDLREKIKQQDMDGFDADNFFVWTDDIYGDLDGDMIPELPVSRIPDGHSGELVINALNALPFQSATRFGIRNLARPFAQDIFESIPGAQAALEVSELFGPAHYPNDKAQGAVYYMLHGSRRDTSKFWGETKGGGDFEAINVNKVPESTPGTVVFTGCCWGILTVDKSAFDCSDVNAIKAKLPHESLALKYLMAGTQAFVGCTGSHYSPTLAPFNYYGKPLHDSFWQGIKNNMSPAEALFYAKREYAKRIPHGRKDPFSMGVEAKILWQYNCLGVGW